MDGKNTDKSKSSEVEIAPEKTKEYTLPSDPQNPVAPIDEITFRDINVPEVVVSSPKAGQDYPRNAKIPLVFEVSDDETEKEDILLERYLDDDEEFMGDILDLEGKELGEHAFWLLAIDEAGNVNVTETRFNIIEASPDHPVPPDPNPILDPEPDPTAPPVSDSVSPPADPEVAEPAEVAPVVVKSSSGEKHKKKKKNKTKKSKAKVKKDSVGGVTKYKGKIKIKSSTVNLLLDPLSISDVFGKKYFENLQNGLLLRGVILPSAENPVADKPIILPAPKTEKNTETPSFSGNEPVVRPKSSQIKFEKPNSSIKFAPTKRVLGASTVLDQNPTNPKPNYALWGGLATFCLLLLQSFWGKIKK